MQDNSQQLDPQVVNLAKAIRQTESGGNFQARGKSGEYGAYQFTPDTWNKYAKDAGVSTPLEQSSLEDQNKVAYTKIKQWKDAGNNVGQVASMWNAGEGEPNAYTGKFSDGSPAEGTNKQGVQFSVPRYAKSVAMAYQSLKSGQPISQQAIDTSPSTTLPPTAPQTGLGAELTQRSQDITEAVKKGISGEINPVSAVLQVAGGGAGAISDVAGAVLHKIPLVSSILDLAGEGVGALARTGAGQSVIGGAQAFAQEHPEAAKNIQAVGNIAMAAPIFEGVGAGVSALKSGVLSNVLEKKALSEAIDIAAPKETAGTLKRAIKSGRVTQRGISGSIGITPEQETINAAKALQGLVQDGKVGAKKSVAENSQAILKEIGNTAENLKTQLGSMEITPTVSQQELEKLMQDSLTKIGEDPTLVGNAGETAQRIFNKFKSFLPQEGDITASNMLDARKQLDSWIQQIKGARVFDPATDNAMTIGLRTIRQGVNGLIAEKAPDVAVKEMLAKQSGLYRALENVASKGYNEVGTTRFGRFTERHPLISGAVKKGVKYGLEGAGFGAASRLLGQ